MRIYCIFDKKENIIPFLQKNQRKIFKEFIESILKNIKFGDFKNYTFGLEIEDKICFIFSTGYRKVFNAFCDELSKRKRIKINEEFLDILNIYFERKREVKHERVLFKTISDVILEDDSAPLSNTDKRFITPIEDLQYFNEVLSKSFKKRFREVKKKDPPSSIKLYFPQKDEMYLLGLDKPLSDGYVKIEGKTLRCFRGYFWLRGEIESLQFVYDYGFCDFTSEGFGCLKIITQK